MAYVLQNRWSNGDFQRGDTPKFAKQVPDLAARAEYAAIYKNGTRALIRAEVPDELILDRRRKSLAAGFLSVNGLFIVKGEIREILENLDPGMHQFFPIDVKYGTTSRPEGQFYVLNLTAQQDSIIDDLSTVEPFPVFTNATPPQIAPPDRNKMSILYADGHVTVDPARQSGLSIWRERRYPGSYLISDQFHDMLVAQGLKFLTPFQTKNI